MQYNTMRDVNVNVNANVSSINPAHTSSRRSHHHPGAIGWPDFSYTIPGRYPDIDHGHPPTFPSPWTFLQDNSQGHFHPPLLIQCSN